MTADERLSALAIVAKKIDKCGGEAIGILQHFDENGVVPEYARDQVLDVLGRWSAAMAEAKSI